MKDDDGARTPAQPLPEARRLKRALESLGVTAYSRTNTSNPHGERGDAAQFAGILAATIEQIETGLRGGALQTQFQKGWLNGYDRDNAALLAALGEQVKDLAGFAGAGIGQVPLASRQFSTAALALLVASRALSAAAEISTDTETGMKTAEALSEKMMLNGRELARYLDRLEAEFGVVEGDPDLSFGSATG